MMDAIDDSTPMGAFLNLTIEIVTEMRAWHRAAAPHLGLDDANIWGLHLYEAEDGDGWAAATWSCFAPQTPTIGTVTETTSEPFNLGPGMETAHHQTARFTAPEATLLRSLTGPRPRGYEPEEGERLFALLDQD